MHPRKPQDVELTDPDLVLPDVRAGRVEHGKWTKERRAWAIRTPRAKLLAKYSIGTSALFGHYVFRYPHREQNRVTPVDLEAADRLMGANISAQHQRRDAVLTAGSSEDFMNALAVIPLDAAIEDGRHDGAVCTAIEMLCQHHGIQLAIATKLLCIKRPALVPMMDSVVQDCFATDNPARILLGFRRLLAEPAIAQRVDELAAAVAKFTGFTPTAVRILDELIWFDWNLVPGTDSAMVVRGFPEWGYETARDDLGVHRLNR